MRKDMYKVIVERPRRGGGYRSEMPMPVDLDDSPKQEGLKRRHRSRKWLNENLRPLERYLASQVGRPWDKVYSEICAGIDRRSTVQQHIHQHLLDFVALRVIEIDGTVFEISRHGDRFPLTKAYSRRPMLYADPASGILREDKAGWTERTAARRRHALDVQTRYAFENEDRRILDPSHQLHRIRGIWYHVTLMRIGAVEWDRTQPIDALRGLRGDRCPAWRTEKGIPSNYDLFGSASIFATSKRQLNASELRHHNLRNLS